MKFNPQRCFFVCFCFVVVFCFQEQTMAQMNSLQASSDSLWQSLLAPKVKKINPFILNKNQFTAICLQLDSTLDTLNISRQYLSYQFKLNKSFSAIKKQLKKKKMSLRSCLRDTILASKTDLLNHEKVELWFAKKKEKYYIKYYTVLFQGNYYFVDRMYLIKDD